VSAQTYASWEAIIVDDGSSDDTATIADSFAARDPRFCVLRQRHGGRSAARTAAMERSRGVYLCPLDADDVYLPEFLEEQHRFIADHPGFDVYSCNVDAWLPDGARTPYFREPEYAREMEIRLEDLLERNRFTILCVFRRRLYERLGGFAPTLDRLEDYEYWLRATAAGARIVHNPATLALYRQYPDSPTAYLHSDLPIQRRILVALIRSHRLTPAQRVRAWDSIRQTEAWTARFELERRLDNGRFCGVRRLLWRARSTYPVASKRALALAAVTISPQLFAALRAGRRHLARLQVKG
jgi:glycosyltransferase involved in cell wall biosynthesis